MPHKLQSKSSRRCLHSILGLHPEEQKITAGSALPDEPLSGFWPTTSINSVMRKKESCCLSSLWSVFMCFLQFPIIIYNRALQQSAGVSRGIAQSTWPFACPVRGKRPSCERWTMNQWGFINSDTYTIQMIQSDPMSYFSWKQKKCFGVKKTHWSWPKGIQKTKKRKKNLSAHPTQKWNVSKCPNCDVLLLKFNSLPLKIWWFRNYILLGFVAFSYVNFRVMNLPPVFLFGIEVALSKGNFSIRKASAKPMAKKTTKPLPPSWRSVFLNCGFGLLGCLS